MPGASKMREIIREGAYGILPPGDSYDDTLPITFLRATEMKPNLKVDLASCHRVAREYFNPKARANIGDVLLAVKGATIASGKCVALIEDEPGEAVVNGSIFRMRFKESVKPKFAAVVLDTPLLKRQMRLGLVANNGVDYLDKSMIHSLVFPVPSNERQHEIISIYEAAADSYLSATNKAREILAGIDDFLLAELGITLPPEPENTLASRIFTAQRRELAGRLDPHFNNRANIALQKTLETVHAVRLRSLVRQVTKGETPLWRGDDYQQEGIQFLRAQNVSPDGLIGDALWIDHAVDLRMQRSRLFGGEILYTMAGTIGIACIYPAERGRANINQAIAKIVLNSEDEIFKSYLVEILNSSICRRQAGRALTVSAQPNINFEQIKSLLIPIPKDGIRVGMIVEKCKATRDKAKHLRQQAQTELESAKRRIEAMLLGDAA